MDKTSPPRSSDIIRPCLSENFFLVFFDRAFTRTPKFVGVFFEKVGVGRSKVAWCLGKT